MAASAKTLWVAVVAATLVSLAGVSARAAVGGGERRELAQYGIVWTFAQPAPAGRYVTGDWWVVGPVTVTAVAPAARKGRHGSVVNPPAGKRQGYDDRIAGYDASLLAAFPLRLEPGQSLVSTASVEKVGDRTAETVRGQYCRGPLRTAAVLTCVAEAPPADAFRPPYVGTEKPLFRAGRLCRDRLPRLAPAGPVPDARPYERYLERIWLDHLYEWPNRRMHPLENMPDYGREITHIVSTVSLELLLDDPLRERERLLRRFVQLGIDSWGVVQSDNDLWRGNGGHNSGRKMPILFAGILLDHDGMQHVRASFAEDDQTYYGAGYRGQKALWQISREPARRHEHLPPDRWAGPPFRGANNGWKSEGYRLLNGPTWVGQALAARLLGAVDLWNHPAFFDYVDRWVAEAKGGTVDKDTGKPADYDPFHGPAREFVEAMWRTYRHRARDIAGRTLPHTRAGSPAR